MKDPFELLPSAPEFEPKEEVKTATKKRNFLPLAFGVFGLALVIMGYFSISRKSVSADVESVPGAKISFSGLPESVAIGDEIGTTVSVQATSALKDAGVQVFSDAFDMSKTASLNSNLKEGQVGYARVLTQEEILSLPKDINKGIYVYLGDLDKDQTRSEQLSLKSLPINSDLATLYVRVVIGKKVQYNCGFLGMAVCTKISGAEFIAQDATSIHTRKTVTIITKPGYNFMTMPYVFTQSAADEFLANMKVKWASIYSTKDADYVDLLKSGNSSMIKPGVGFWIYDEKGGSYPLPKDKVEVNYNDPFSLTLEQGWNQIGNPYARRIIFSGDKILVKEVSDDGSPTGAIYSLQSAIQSGALSSFSVVQNKPFVDSNSQQNDIAKLIEYKTLALESTVDPYTAMVVNSTKKLNLIFPAKEIIASGDLLDDKEKQQIQDWIATSGLNQYSDPQNTVYSNGTPLINPSTNQIIDQYDYIISKHPDRPWKEST